MSTKKSINREANSWSFSIMPICSSLVIFVWFGIWNFDNNFPHFIFSICFCSLYIVLFDIVLFVFIVLLIFQLLYFVCCTAFSAWVILSIWFLDWFFFWNCQRDGEKLQDEGSTARMNRLEIKRSGLYGIQDHTSRSTTNSEYNYPQVGKIGVDAVHESCPQMVYFMKNCNL